MKFLSFVLFRLIRLNTVTALTEEYGRTSIFEINSAKLEYRNKASCIFMLDLAFEYFYQNDDKSSNLPAMLVILVRVF